VLVDLSGAEPVTELVPAPVPRRLADVTGTLDQLLGAGGEAHVEDWVRVTVTDAARPPELFRRVRDRFPHALVVQHAPADGAARTTASRVVTAAADPLEVVDAFVRRVTGTAPTPAEVAVLRRAYEDVADAERSA
jgi:exonuclease SbcD